MKTLVITTLLVISLSGCAWRQTINGWLDNAEDRITKTENCIHECVKANEGNYQLAVECIARCKND